MVADQKKKLADDKKLADEKEKAMAEEIEKLRAELKKDKDEAPPGPSSSRRPMRRRWAKSSAGGKEDKEAFCTFGLDKHQLMDLPEGALMPKYQDIKKAHPTMLVPFTISLRRRAPGARQEDPHDLAPVDEPEGGRR